jgi:hypothetical protein
MREKHFHVERKLTLVTKKAELAFECDKGATHHLVVVRSDRTWSMVLQPGQALLPTTMSPSGLVVMIRCSNAQS